MLLLIFSLPITSLKTTKMGMTLKVWILLFIWLSNFFLVIGYMCLQTRNLCTETISLFSEVIHLPICFQCTFSLPPEKITCSQG